MLPRALKGCCTIPLWLISFALHATPLEMPWKPIMQSRFHRQFIDKLPEADTKALALFSESGYADLGQIILVKNEANSTFFLYQAKPGQDKLNDPITFNDTKKELMDSFFTRSASLPGFDAKAFDGIQFELLVLTVKERKINVINHVFFNNPRPDTAQMLFIKDLQDLIK